MNRLLILGACLSLVACGSEPSAVEAETDGGFVPAGEDAGADTATGDAPANDAPVNDAPASDVVTVPEVAADSAMTAAPAVPGEKSGVDGAQTLSIAADGEAIVRVESAPSEHIHFMLTFDPPSQPVVLRVDRWDGAVVQRLGATDAGGGLRTLAVFDGKAKATFWARVTSTAAFTGKLTITRTPFADGETCPSDCARLMQLPLPNDPLVDGYDTDSGTIYRYWFGRRDMLMLLRHAAHRMLAMGKAPFFPYDLSQWNGETPGVDVGAPRHASHQRGKDVDVSLYGSDGKAHWRTFCTTANDGSGRECVNGSAKGLDDRGTARELAGFYEGGIVTMMFLDRELIELVAPAAKTLATDGTIGSTLVPLYSDGSHLQHWPNHDNHVHVRIAESAKSFLGTEPIEPP